VRRDLTGGDFGSVPLADETLEGSVINLLDTRSGPSVTITLSCSSDGNDARISRAVIVATKVDAVH
jgi:hypothetical protein